MGLSNNSHGRKVDKETQSPLLKIFKDIMTREKDDPEKRNLLLEQKEDKKRRQYSGSRTRTDRRSCESSSSEHRKRGLYKTSSTEQRAEFKQTRPQSMPYQSEKKDSWWFWQKEQNPKNQATEETCSCVSCADFIKRQEKAASENSGPRCDFGDREQCSLKRIVSSEYACIGCLLLLFTISIIVAFFVVFRSVPSVPSCDTTTCPTTTTSSSSTCSTEKPTTKCTDSERLKRKIEMLNENRMNNELSEVDEYHKSDKKSYDDLLQGNLGVSSEIGIDFGPSFRELNSLDESENKASGDLDWTSMLETDKSSDLQSSEKLKEFYKKLVQTDAKIKSLKKINQASFLENEESILKSPERSKRSLKLYSYPKRYHVLKRRRIFDRDHSTKDSSFMKRRSNKTRIKRLTNDSEEPTGFVIEKKKLIVQYKPAGVRKKIPVKKCSHAPKDSHTHENQLKHPFYQNTQRLDELLDRFLNKNLPEIMSDPFGLDALFNHDKASKCKHPNPTKNVDIIAKDTLVDQIPKPKGKSKKLKEDKKNSIVEVQPPGEVLKMLRPESSTQYEKDFYHHEVQMIGKEKQKVVTASPNDFEVLLSVSTIMNPDVKKTGSMLPTVSLLEKVPKLRRLMQLEVEDEENLGYEDFKEVLTDDTENHDELDKRADRKKRRDEEPWPTETSTKYNPPGVHNPNWKGPMPLYPDELNSMIRHAALNSNKVEIPSSSNDLQSGFLERRGRDISDVEYVEDYLKNKYDQLVEMAQAYSDYGVLDGKKDSRNDKNSASDSTATDHRIKLALDDNYKAGLLERLKKDRVQSFVTTPAGNIRRQRDVTTEMEETTEQTGGSSNTLNLTIPHTSEGIRFEIRPTAKSRDDDLEVLKILQKHIKIEPSYNLHQNLVKPNPIHSTLISSYPDVELVYSTKPDLKPKPGKFEPKKSFKSSEDTEKENGLIFSMNRGRRNLLSTDFKRTNNFRTNKDTTGDWTENFNSPISPSSSNSPNRNRSAIEKFVQNLNIKRYNLTNEKALARYIERVKQKNIRIFSTPHPDFSSKHTTAEFTEDNNFSTFSPLKVFRLGTQSLLNDTIVTINRSEIKMDEYTGNNFLGKILLTVQNPDIGEQHIDIKFDVPLAINWHDELMMMSDNIKYPNIYNQFEMYTESSIEQNDQNEQNETDIELDLGPSPDEGSISNRTYGTRHKRDASLFHDSQETTTKSTTHSQSNVTSNNSLHLNVSVSSRSLNKSEPDMTLSDFFMMVSDWFKTLEGSKVVKPRNNSSSDVTEILLNVNGSTEMNSSTEPVYPNYDSDMIENIGHRSRVLLSIENLGNNTDVKRETGDTNITRVKKTESSGGNVSNTANSSTPLTNLNSNITTPKKDTDTKSNVHPIDSKRKTKAIFKRNADDSNLIFWNDIYDDEYGIQTDTFDNSIRDKHSVKENRDFIKRSGRWVHDKIKKFAENLKINPRTENMAVKEREARSMKGVPRAMEGVPRYLGHVPRSMRPVARSKSRVPRSMSRVHRSMSRVPRSMNRVHRSMSRVPRSMSRVPRSMSRVPPSMSRVPRSMERVPRSVRYPRLSTYPKYLYERIYDRFTRKDSETEEEDYDEDEKSIFTALSSNMKEVCKKAARAVQQTRNIEGIPSLSFKPVREDSKQGSIAASLMQQLVRLLTDLVDYQVQQKTCTRLPADLQSFLEWLTFPRDDVQDSQSESLTLRAPFQEEDLIEELEMQSGDDKTTDHSQDMVTPPSIEKQSTIDMRMHYLDCLHSVQDLLDQYEEMADDDKSKMTGVKNYLENQIRFLNKQLSGYELFTLFEKHHSMRYKRDLTKKPHQNLIKRPRRKLHKFMKNFGKKHTRTTASFYDAIQVTDMKRKTATENILNVKIGNDFDEKVSNDVKRNLKDVYYKAIAEAKKYATAKNVHKKDEITHFVSTTVKAKE